jgi:hypothetical protein
MGEPFPQKALEKNMKHRILGLSGIALLVLTMALAARAQQTAAASEASAVPSIVNFSGMLTDLDGRPLTGITGVTFLLYKDEQGGAPLWMETQNVQPDKNGHYTVTLGSTTSQGLPQDVFVSGEARWLGVQVQGQNEKSRALLVAVPYALKAHDAETIGGLPPSAFVLAAPAANNGSTANVSSAADTAGVTSNASSDVTTTGGTVNAVPLFTTATNIQNSILTQTGTSTVNVAGIFNHPATGAATKTIGKDSQPENFVASSFSSTTSTAVNQVFQWQAEPAANDTASPSGTLNLLYGLGATTPSETGLKLSNKGLFTFAAGQTFPGTGTITGITTASGSGLSGGGTSGTLSLSIPAAGVTNAMLKSSSVTLNANAAGGLTTPGAMSLGNTYTIGLKTCAANQVLEFIGTAWSCATPTLGTVTSVGSGAGLTGGPISGSGTLSIATGGVLNTMLQNSKVTVTAGTDLTGGGAVSLGGTTTLNVDTTKIPQLAGTTPFTAAQTINGPSSAVALTVDSSGSLADPQVEIVQNNTADGARLRLATSGSTNYWDIFGFAGSAPQLNFWNGGVGLNVLQIFPSYVEANANLYVNNGAGLNGGNGANIYGTEYGVYANSSGFDGADLFAGTSASFGSLSESDADANENSAAAAWEYGATKENFGVWGYTASPIGVANYSEGYSASTEGTKCCAGEYSIGSWSDTSGGSGTVAGIANLSTVDDGYAVVAYNNVDSDATAWIENDETANTTSSVLVTFGGNTLKGCVFDVSGDLSCDGTITPSVAVGGSKKVALYGVAAAENWFEDAGSGQLSNGSAVVNLEGTFAQTVNTGVEYHVFLTPNGDCKGLYVSRKGATSFEVHELGGGTSNVAFDYRIMAKRAGFETARLEDRSSGPNLQGPKRRPAGTQVTSPDDVRKAHMQKAEELRKIANEKASMSKTLKR